MAAKLYVTTLDGMEPAVAALYRPNDVGFELQIDGVEEGDAAALKYKNGQLIGEIRKLKAKLAAQPAPEKPEGEMTPRERFFAAGARRLAGLTGEARAQEFAKIEAEMEPLLAAEVEAYGREQESKLEKLRGQTRRLIVEQHAQRIAADIGRPECAPVLLPHITARLGVRLQGEDGAKDDEAFVVGADGKPSAATIEALKDELRAAPALSPLIRGTSAIEKAAHAKLVAAATGKAPPLTPITRQAFDALSPAAQQARVSAGGTVLDTVT